MKHLWLLKLVRTVVNQITAQLEDDEWTPQDKRIYHIANSIRNILIEENINEQ